MITQQKQLREYLKEIEDRNNLIVANKEYKKAMLEMGVLVFDSEVLQ